MYEYRAIVLRVLDADTIDVDIDLGFDIWRRERVRMAGIDAPELRQEGGSDARAFVINVLDLSPEVLIRTEKPYPHDKYGRYLASIVLNDGRVLNDLLVEAGHARAYDGGAR